MSGRNINAVDNLIVNVDQALRTLFGRPKITERSNPAHDIRDTELSETERDHIARLMRINHTGEVCAQALYQGQALTARRSEVKYAMERSAAEENDHLDWCEQRVEELGGRTSLLNPLFYAGSFALGATAGLAGDKWSLGFVSETETQVEGHLDEHLAQIPEQDHKTRTILELMKADEIRHGEMARAHGGARLPLPVRLAMKMTAKIMTTSVYRL